MGLTFEEQAGEMFRELKDENAWLTEEYAKYRSWHQSLMSKYMKATDIILRLEAKIMELEEEKEQKWKRKNK